MPRYVRTGFQGIGSAFGSSARPLGVASSPAPRAPGAAVVHARERLVEQLESRPAGPQAPVDVLVVGEVRLVEEADPTQRLGRDQDAAPDRDRDLAPAVEP